MRRESFVLFRQTAQGLARLDVMRPATFLLPWVASMWLTSPATSQTVADRIRARLTAASSSARMCTAGMRGWRRRWPRGPGRLQRMRTTSEILEHTAEVRVRVRGPTLGDIAAEAGRALGRLELGTERPAPHGEWRTVEVHAPDRDALLVEWLNELIYLAETERWVAVEIEPESAMDTAFVARARGVTVEEAPARVKAATYHGLRVTPVAGGLEAEVVLDV